MSGATRKPGSRLVLWLVGAVCVAPFVLAAIAYFLWPPAGRVNYGELLPLTPLPAARAALLDGGPFDFARLAGKWVYVTIDSGTCDAHCENKLWKMRQVRLTRGQHMERVERVWLLDDRRAVDAAIRKAYDGTWMVRAAESILLKAFPARGTPRDHIYLVDPLGHVILRYPRDADPSRMKQDLGRLLKVSRIG